jgi:hypothetical protein
LAVTGSLDFETILGYRRRMALDERQEHDLCELWGIASMLTGDLAGHPYKGVATPPEESSARALRNRIDEWLSRDDWPGDDEFAGVCKQVVSLHGTLFNRRQQKP